MKNITFKLFTNRRRQRSWPIIWVVPVWWRLKKPWYQICRWLSYLPVSQEVQDRIRKKTSQDDKLQQLLDTVLDEWPNNKADLTTGNKSLLKFPRWTFVYWWYSLQITQTEPMQYEMLETLHIGHQGIVETKNRARDILFWTSYAHVRSVQNIRLGVLWNRWS